MLVARALVADPLCLVLDEPCAGMDPGAREQSPGWLATHLCAGGPAVILVTHHVEEILPVFDRTLILRDGRPLSRRATADVLTRDAFESGRHPARPTGEVRRPPLADLGRGRHQRPEGRAPIRATSPCGRPTVS